MLLNLRFCAVAIGVFILAAGMLAAQQPPSTDTQRYSGAIWVGADEAAYRTSLQADRLVSRLNRLPFETVILEVYTGAQAYFESARAPRANGVSDRLDPLGRIIEGLSKGAQPKRVIAWVDPLTAGRADGPQPQHPDHPLNAHPDWLSVRANGQRASAEGRLVLEAGLPAVRDHVAAVVDELADQYDLAGIYVDPLGDPTATGDWGYHPEVIRQWSEQTGQATPPNPNRPEWIAFRARMHTQLFEALEQAADNRVPILVGARAEGPTPENDTFDLCRVYTHYHQNWPQWMASGRVDQLVLKNFWPEGSSAAAFDHWTRFALSLGRQSDTPVTIGVAGTLNESIDVLAQMRRAANAGAANIALENIRTPVRDTGASDLFMKALERTVLAREFKPRPKPSLRTRLEEEARQTTPAAPTEPTTGTGQTTPSAAAPPVDLPPPPQIEGAQGRMIPLTGELARAGEPASVQRETAGEEPLTRREMLQELLNNQKFEQDRQWAFIRPDQRAREYLQKTFKNIF